MPVYKLDHTSDCGFSQNFFLKEDKETVITPCLRCGRDVSCRQIRDKRLVARERDGLIGIMEKTNDQTPEKEGNR